MSSNEEPCKNSDESYSAEDVEDGTDPICNQQRGRKRRKRKKNKTKTVAEFQGVKVTTGKNKTHETLCICQKNKNGISSIRTAAGRKAIIKSAPKKGDLVLARIRSTNSIDTFVYHSGNVCFMPYILFKTKSQ